MYDATIIGSGPAGANAALEAHDLGLKVLIVDEQRDAGGQIWRVKSKSILSAPSTEASIKGDALRERLKQSSIEVKFETRVWHIDKNEEKNWIINLVSKDGSHSVLSKALIIATGAQERVIPVQGWTLPGVVGLAGATALFKEHMMVPGKSTVVAGSGPLVFFVASEVIRLGGSVAAVVSINGFSDWIKALPAMVLNPKLLWQGIKWIGDLYLKRVPLYWRHGIRSFEGLGHVVGVNVRKANKKWYLRHDPNIFIAADSVCYGHGLMPSIEASRLAGAVHTYEPALGGWVPFTDENGRTTVPYLYVCGDNAGILGAQAAPHRGRLAAYAMVEDLNETLPEDLLAKRKAEKKLLKWASIFGKAATGLSILQPGAGGLISKQTEVCRCEGINRLEIEKEVKTGALSPNAVKSGTRCGMGPCGGRFCSESMALITEQATGKTRAEIGLPTARPPLRPVAMDEIAKDLNYDDLPIPGVSPL